MTEDTKDRYDIDKIPISDKTRQGLTDNNINLIGAVGRMLSLQDDFIEDILIGIQQTVGKIEKRLDAIELRLDNIEESLVDKEGRLRAIEHHIGPGATFIRVGFGVLIGVIFSIVAFIFIHPYLK
jgi:hypothetical protein